MGDVLAPLLAQRPRFVAFVRRQVADDAAAEDIVQGAFARAAATPALHEPGHATGWFYRVLRNAIVDHYRRRSASAHALENLERESAIDCAPARRPVCDCVFKVLPGLREEYQTILRAVEIDGRAVEEVARQLGITANNASVRLHRARNSLRERLDDFCRNCCADETVDACRDCYCHD
jgi:RNA polymerase sigma-70 factor (ECF subfamily)